MRTQSRRRAERDGRLAEALAAIWLRLKGYHILARRGAVMAVVEVKVRRDRSLAAEAITPQQWRRLARAAGWTLAHRPEWAGLSLRFDALLLARGRLPQHVADAWRPEWNSVS